MRLAVTLHQLGARHRQGLLDHDLRQKRQVIAHFHDRQRASQLTRGDTENHTILDAAECAHLRLQIFFRYAQQLLPDQGMELVATGRAVQRRLVQELIHQLRAGRKALRQPDARGYQRQ